MLSKPLDYILKWKGHVLKEEQSEAADRGELVPHPAACGESPVCWQTGEEEEPRVFQIKLCQSKVLMWPLYEEEMYALSFIHSNKRPQVRSNHLHWLFLLFALCYTWWTDLCVGFFVDFFFFSEEDYRWFTWFLLCPLQYRWCRQGWGDSIFILVRYPSTTQGTADVQPECKGDLAGLGILHKQVKQDTWWRSRWRKTISAV